MQWLDARSSVPITAPRATTSPACTLALTGSYVVRTPPWSTTTTPRPASGAAKVIVPASEECTA
jgi:hypothetical protein